MQPTEQQKVLITGGAGFLGINLIRHLMAKGYALVSLDVEEFDYPEKYKIEAIKGDIRDKALLDRAMEDVDFVVHTAAALPLYAPEDIYTTDVEGTRNV
ncbi:MAG: NAD-dependent epimerase/dehydratase family protein, partial [Actinobacteria bacterium]|nr:NAD-dependent epimerase/dehydratase family protein [Actinomycetota bacterium]